MTAPAPPPRGRACPTCGTVYLPPTMFCPRHGKRLEEVAAPAAAAPAAPASPATASGQVLDGRYQVRRRLGEGGMATVYLAWDPERDREVALKVILPRVAKVPGAIERLQREAAIARRLDHPNVCRVLDFGWTPDRLFYLVLPFVEGETLGAYLARTGPLAPPDAIRRLADVCHGLHYAHGQGVVHRDMKPDNVMLMPAAGGRAVIMDFGLAKEAQAPPGAEKLTATGFIVGTPAYMSPEQLCGGELDARSDQYAVGCMAYELLTGRLPFEGSNPAAIMIARLQQTPAPLASVRPGIPPSLAAAVMRALRSDPTERFPTMYEFALEMQSAT